MRPEAGPELDGLVERVHRAVVARGRDGDPSPGPEELAELARARSPLLAGDDVAEVVSRVSALTGGLGPLDAVLADTEVTEVMVNGPGPVWVERGGAVLPLELELDAGAIERIIERVVAPLGLRIDRSSPLVDARLPDGSRVNAVVPPLAVDGPCLTIRRFVVRSVPLEAVAPTGVAPLLAWAVRARLNIVVSGGTGAGKTTLLNGLAAEVPATERVITVEDTAELCLPGPHVVRLEARPPNAEGAGGVSVRQLVRNALRMRPDRIVVGECRGEEALDMLQAMNTGHEGSLSTCHANSPADALRRLETMVLGGTVALPLAAVREQLAAALDLVVQMARHPDGTRRVVAVAEVVEGGGQAGGPRTRALADAGGLRSLPGRRSRLAAAPVADPAWLAAGAGRP